MIANVSEYKITLSPLSPLHIGSGDVLDPYEYFILSQDGYDFLYTINLSGLIEQVSPAERQQLLKILDTPDLFAQRKAIAELAGRYFSSKPYLFTQFSTVTQELKTKYLSLLHQPKAPFRLEVHTMTRDPKTQMAYVPGSSLKGAIRTAWLNYLTSLKDERELEQELAAVTEQRIPFRWAPKPRQAQIMEALLLGNEKHNDHGMSIDIQKDPFRAIQITDLFQTQPTVLFSHIAKLNILQKNNGSSPQSNRRPSGGEILLYCDCLVPWEGENLALTGRMSFQSHLWTAEWLNDRTKQSEKVITGEPITAQNLLNALNTFYRNRFKLECENYYTKQKNWGLDKAADKLKENIEKIDPGCEALVRVGRFSQFESMTLNRFHNKSGVRVRFGASRTAAKADSIIEHSTPLGWCKLRLDRI